MNKTETNKNTDKNASTSVAKDANHKCRESKCGDKKCD
jgi:hypothetical protein